MAGWDVFVVPRSRAVQCQAVDAPSLARFQNGCSKLHLWSELIGFADTVLYIDADSFVLPAVFDAAAILESHSNATFAAKPVPPTSTVTYV
jgi:hypothetical protein